MLAALFLTLSLSQTQNKPLTLGDLRKLVPVDLRPASPAGTGIWRQVMEAAKSARKVRLESIQDPASLIQRWRKPVNPDLRTQTQTVLNLYAGSIRLMQAALSAPRWASPLPPNTHSPGVADLMGDDFAFSPKVTTFTRLFLLQAYLSADSNDGGGVVESLSHARSVGEHFASPGFTVTDYLVGSGCEAMAEDAARWLAAHSNLSGPQLRRLAALCRRANHRPAFAGALRREFDRNILSLIAITDRKSREWPPGNGQPFLEGHPRPFDARQTTLLAADVWRRRMLNLTGTWNARKPSTEAVAKIMPADAKALLDQEARPSPQALRAGRRRLRQIDNPVGRDLVTTVFGTDPQENWLAAPFRDDARSWETALVFAAQVYRRRTGRYPGRLADLTRADGIDRPPLDPFSGRPFGYDARTGLLWSLGPEGKHNLADGLTFSVKTGEVVKPPSVRRGA